jgi:hypothetical protein
MARSANLKRRSANGRQQQPVAVSDEGTLSYTMEDVRSRRRGSSSTISSTSMALTATNSSITSNPREANKSSNRSANTTELMPAGDAPAVSAASLSVTQSGVENPLYEGRQSIPQRKRVRDVTSSRSGDDHPPSTTRSPSVSAITGGLETVMTVSDTPRPPRLCAGGHHTHSTHARHLHGSATRTAANGAADDEVFVDASNSPATGTVTASATPLRRLQGTPTSQLLSQLQDMPYTTQSNATPQEGMEGQDEEVEAAVLFTPATVARRRVLPVVAEVNRVSSPAAETATAVALATRATTSSGSRGSSVHDAAVQAILRANPPTTTRAVELKPGYRVPSPCSPLWAALDDNDSEVAEEDRHHRHHSTRDSTRSEDDLLWSNTQVSLFQEDEEGRVSGSGGHGYDPALTATQERRRFSGTRRTAQDRISLPAPGRSVNLLDDEDLHGDERPLLFVGERNMSSRADGNASPDEESFVFSLTQEACKQEREQDQQAALPRSRHRRHATADAAAAVKAAAVSTPSPPRRGARTGLRASQQASPFSQLQRDVELASSFSTTAVTAAASPTSKPVTTLSQRELRRRADMLKWAERTRAFFHFIDTLPLHVSHSPLKPTAATVTYPPQPSRRSKSQTITTLAAPDDARRSKTGNNSGCNRSGGGAAATTYAGPAASMSLVRRSHSAVVVAPAQASRRGSAAFEAVVSRVKREAAVAASSKSQRSSVTVASRTSAS